jgi:hypothetical protein
MSEVGASLKVDAGRVAPCGVGQRTNQWTPPGDSERLFLEDSIAEAKQLRRQFAWDHHIAENPAAKAAAQAKLDENHVILRDLQLALLGPV